jgi:Circularly permutated YpsA SLOG family
MKIQRIISGGQTGADRAALDWALACDIPHGGWCPHGRQAEDGRLAEHYQLQETPLANSAQRTEWNVRDADGTVIFSIVPELSEGTLLTAEFATRYEKPWINICQARSDCDPAQQLLKFLANFDIQILNVAGVRASQATGIYQFVWVTLNQALALGWPPKVH